MAVLQQLATSNHEIYVTAYFIPLSTIAKWPNPKGIKNADSRQWYTPWSATLMVISTITIGVRFYAQYTRRIRKPGLDDLFIVLAWLLAIAFTASTSYGVLRAGFDRHIWENIGNAEIAGKIAYFAEIFFLASTCLSKLSVLTFQRRLLQRTHNPRYTRAIDCAIVFTVMFWLAFFLFLIFSCTPTRAAWKSMDITYDEPFKCRHRNIPDPMTGILSVASDIYALIIPELLIYKLRLERKTKLILYLVFGSGLLVVGAGIARTVWLERLFSDPLRDLTWVAYDTMVWGAAEVQFSLVCASAPALKAFISNLKAGMTRAASANDSGDDRSIPRFRRFQSTLPSTIEEDVIDGKKFPVTETVNLNNAQIDKNEKSSTFPKDIKGRGPVSAPTYSSEKMIPELKPWVSSTSLPTSAETPRPLPTARAIGSISSEAPSYKSTDPLNATRAIRYPRARSASESSTDSDMSESGRPVERLTFAEMLRLDK